MDYKNILHKEYTYVLSIDIDIFSINTWSSRENVGLDKTYILGWGSSLYLNISL